MEAIYVGGYFNSKSVELDDAGYTLTNEDQSSSYRNDGMIVKYKKSEEGGKYEIEWATSVGGNMEDEITCITETSDGGYICRRIF